MKRLWLSGISKLGNRIFVRKNPIRAVSYTTFLLYIYPCCLHHHGQSCISSFHVSSYFQVMVEKSNIKGVQETSCICTGGPLIVLKNGSIFLAKPYYENTNKIGVLWEELENLLNKQKPYYREIRTMRGLTVLHAYCYYLMRYQSQSQFCTLKMSHANVHLKTITKQLKGKICLALHRTMIVVPNLLHVF